MKRLIAVAALILFTVVSSKAQTATTFSITVDAPPSCTVTLAPNPASTSGSHLRSGQAGGINFNISACSIAGSSVTATWDGAATPTVFVASPASLSVPVTAAQATAGPHSLVLTIPWPLLALANPAVILPNALVGQPYNANLAALSGPTGGVAPYTFSLDPTTPLPSGLTLSSSGVVSGVASGTGSSSFGFTVTDSSILAGHSGALRWTASIGGSIPAATVAGYNVYRGDQLGGPTRSSTLRSFQR